MMSSALDSSVPRLLGTGRRAGCADVDEVPVTVSFSFELPQPEDEAIRPDAPAATRAMQSAPAVFLLRIRALAQPIRCRVSPDCTAMSITFAKACELQSIR